MSRIYTICHADADSGGTIASFATEAARDATWDAIQAIPWHRKPGYLGYDDWAEREVKIRGWLYYDHPKRHGIHGQIYRGSTELLDAPMDVTDVTDRAEEESHNGGHDERT